MISSIVTFAIKILSPVVDWIIEYFKIRKKNEKDFHTAIDEHQANVIPDTLELEEKLKEILNETNRDNEDNTTLQ
jgi:hypothetical protein